jgi:hypothetical protein
MDERNSKNSKQTFIRMIYDAVNSTNLGVGTLGQFLIEKAHEFDNELDSTEQDHIAEEELVRKIKEFKAAEENQNLVWMDYNSWKSLPAECKACIQDLLDPLHWTGVFFRYDLFLQHEQTITKLLDKSGYLYLLSEHKRNFYLVWVACDSKYYDWLHESKMKEFSKMFLERLIKSYGIDADGNVVVKAKALRK